MGYSVTNFDRKEDGVWVNHEGELVETPNPEHLELLVAPAGTKRYDYELQRFLTRRPGGRRNFRPEEVEKAEVKALVDHVILGWRHLEDAQGREIPYSKDMAARLLVENRKFLNLVRTIAEDEYLFRVEPLEDTVKNSSRGSNGISNGDPSKPPWKETENSGTA